VSRGLLALTFLASCGTSQAQLYKIESLSESQIRDSYKQSLREAFRWADREWHFSPADQTGYWGNGISVGNEGIRTIGDMIFAAATLLKYDNTLSPDERRDFLAKASAALRYVTLTHNTGTQKCPDGKQWGATQKFGGESWQSGMWTGTIAFGAWLIWDKLDAALQHDIERVMAWESDILAAREPPTSFQLDTKAEENAWEVPCLVLSELMFSQNPHAASWRQAALKYMMNTLSTEGDLSDTTLVDGRPSSSWVRGANLHSDYTLENHNIFHPSYVACSTYFLTQAQMYYRYAGRSIPQAAAHHVHDVWRVFQTIILPWGEAAYPQGMDWELHSLPYINLFASLATHDHDAFAARAEQTNLQYMLAWQKMDGGSLAFPGSSLGITRHAINCEQLAYSMAAHEIFGPGVKPAATRLEGVWEYPDVDVIIHRTARKFVSFSWKNKFMGLLIPIGEGHDTNPEFTVPIPTGLTGSFELSPRGDVKTTVVDHSRRKVKDGFETTGTLLLNGGRLKQTLRLSSLPNQLVVYQDRVTAVSDVTVQAERGVPIGIENDEITGGIRTVTTPDQRLTFDWRMPQPPAKLPSWADVDGRVGIVMLSGAGVTYAQSSTYTRGMSVRADILYGSYSDTARQYKTGDEVAHRIIVFAMESTSEETAALAHSCGIESNTLHCGDIQVPLI
jgi:hypothetical protein